MSGGLDLCFSLLIGIFGLFENACQVLTLDKRFSVHVSGFEEVTMAGLTVLTALPDLSNTAIVSPS